MQLLPAETSASLVNQVHCMDIFELCDRVYRAGIKVDCIACDLPYGTTACAWDTVIPFAPMWAAFKRVIKPRGAIVLTASQPFTSALVMSNPGMFRCEWIWDKGRGVNFANANYQPMKAHESVLIFSDEATVYYPQFWYSTPYQTTAGQRKNTIEGLRGGSAAKHRPATIALDGKRYPLSIIEFTNGGDAFHPTQKPVALFRYLIRTYTRPDELVFDPTCGSGTTAVAAREEGRRFIVGDSSLEYVQVARDRLALPYTPSFMHLLDSA